MTRRKTKMKNLILVIALALLIPTAAAAQGNAFSFQGRLNDGATPANGSYDLQFRLYDSITGGTQIESTALRPSTTLINGVFSVTLDFGATAFNSPNSVFIEISVKPAGSPNAYTILGPRQQLTVVPFAVRASSASQADSATNATNASQLNGLNSSGFIRNSVAPIGNQNFNIVGNGVINGTLNVAGNTTIGSPTITSDLNISGKITAAGNAAQNRDKSGFVKALVYVKYDGTIYRCFNGITGSTTGNCGISIDYSGQTTPGVYAVDFPFQVNDRFVAVTAEAGTSVTLNASFKFTEVIPNRVIVDIRITDVDHSNSNTAGDFMIMVF